MTDPSIGTSIQGGTLWDRVRSSPVDQAQLNGVNTAKTILLYLYLLRCPILTLLAIWPGLYFGFQTSLLRGLADLQGGGKNGPILGILTVSTVAFLAVLAAVVAANLTLIYGELRLFGTDTTPANVPVNTSRRLFIFVPAVAIYVLFLFSLWPYNVSQPDFNPVKFIAFAILGTFLAVSLVFVLNYVQLRLAHPTGQQVGAFLAIPFRLPRTVDGPFHRGWRTPRSSGAGLLHVASGYPRRRNRLEGIQRAFRFSGRRLRRVR